MQVEAQQLLLKLANPRICALIVECIHNEKKPKSKTNTGNLKYEDSVMELHQILSHISPKQIERTLIYTAGNKELAVDLILNDVPITEEVLMEAALFDQADASNPIATAQDHAELEALETQFLFHSKMYKQLDDAQRALEAAVEEAEKSPIKSDRIQETIFRETNKVDKALSQAKLSRNVKFYFDDERACIMKNNVKFYKCRRSNIFDFGAEEIHFRLCESQFNRFYYYQNQQQSYPINHDLLAVDYLVNPPLSGQFESAKIALAKKYSFLPESVKPIILFHGTKSDNMEPIMRNNFKLKMLGKNTGNTGAYGAGIYFSSFATYSMGYSHGTTQMLMCYVIVGKAFVLNNPQTGMPLTAGYDCHVAPGDAEVVIYQEENILPAYRITYGPLTKPNYGEFFTWA